MAPEKRFPPWRHNLEHLIDYAIRYFKHLIKTYGGGKERKSEIRIFDEVDAKKVVVRNLKLYINKEEGFIKDIPGLFFDKKKKIFTIKCQEKDRVSTSKNLAPKTKKSKIQTKKNKSRENKKE